MQGPGSFLNVIANTVVISGAAGVVTGIFVYVGTPAHGNPPVIWLTESATDPYNNTLPFTGAGFQNGSNITRVDGGEIDLGTVLANTLASISTGNGTLSLTSGKQNAGDVVAGFTLASTTPSATGAPLMTLFSATALSVTGGTPANPVDLSTDTWNNMSLAAGFTAGVPAPQFKLMPDRTVMCKGIVTLSAGQVAGTVFATLGANYTAGHGTQFVTRNTLAGYAAGNGSVANAGGASTLAIVVAGNAGNVVQLDGVRYSTES